MSVFILQNKVSDLSLEPSTTSNFQVALLAGSSKEVSTIKDECAGIEVKMKTLNYP